MLLYFHCLRRILEGTTHDVIIMRILKAETRMKLNSFLEFKLLDWKGSVEVSDECTGSTQSQRKMSKK